MAEEPKKKNRIRLALGNMFFKLPLPNKIRLAIGKRIYAKENRDFLEKTVGEMSSVFDEQFKLFEITKELCPHFAKWMTDEHIAKVKGGKLILSGALMVMADYMHAIEIDAFYEKYVDSDEMNQNVAFFWFRLAYQAKEWGFFKDANTAEESNNVLDEQELVNLFQRVGHELTRFIQQQTMSTLPYETLHAEMLKYLSRSPKL